MSDNQGGDLAAKKRELLALLLDDEEDELPQPPLVRQADRSNLPLSFTQQRLWFLDQLEPASAFYNLPTAVRLSGQLNVAALEASLNEIVRRHENLRTSFPAVDGQPSQVVAPSLTLPLPVVSLRDLPQEQRVAEALRLATEQTQLPFDLAQGPLIRATLLQLDEEEHVLLFITHHIVSDGWSFGVLLRELRSLYEAFVDGKPSPLPELPIQHADYAAWQRQWLQGGVLQTQLDYWKKQLAGAPPAIELPTYRSRPPVQTYRGATQSVLLPPLLADRLKTLSRREGATLFMTLLAAFQTLLYRYTGQDDIVVGTPIANRTRPEVEGLIGFFANTLALRTDLGGDPTFRELLGRVRTVALDSYAHQDLPFDRLVEALQPDRNLSYHPVFQVLFILQNAPMPPVEMGGLTLTTMQVDSGTATFDLTLMLVDTERGLEAVVEYGTDLFDGETISHMMGHYHTLLQAVVANPDERISQLPLLTEEEQRQVLLEWNATDAEYPKEQCVHHLFEQQVEKSPDKVVLIFGTEEVTYKELNEKANQLARYLRKLGVGPDVLVGICVERSIEMMVGLLGILKAGGAYVPLDPAYPKERLAFMLRDSQAPVLLTQEHLMSDLPEHGARVVCLDAGWSAAIAHEGTEDTEGAESGVTSNHLAYVIYTSGSTGKPKGVQIPHRALTNLLYTMMERPGITSTDVLIAVTSLSFDIAGLELYMPLVAGARVVVADRETTADGALLREEINRTGATMMQATPATWKVLLAAGWPLDAETGGSKELKVLCGGEALPAALAAELRRHSPSVWNMYGPTETTIWSSTAEVGAEANAYASIGWPIANTQIYVLDKRLQPVPANIAGELYIGGDGLARGYLNRPDLTAERFLPTPFSETPGERLYKTGDLVRYLPDGNIEFIGRIDNQVKVRGFRIELGEIETVLGQHPGVRGAVVTVREDVPGDQRLVAYLVPDPSQAPTASELRAYVRERLPEYMVPSTYVHLDRLPLTPNGKVDRKALPAPDEARPEQDQALVAPRTPVEDVVAGIWASLLRIERVGAYDNFFTLGGHSLLATQVMSRLRDAFRVELPLRTIFEAPAVAALAEQIQAAMETERGLQAPPLLPAHRPYEEAANSKLQRANLPLSFAQQRLWFLDQLEAGSPFYNISIALRLSGKLDEAALERSLNEIVKRHEALRTTFSTVQGQPVQVISPDLAISLPVADLQDVPTSEREAVEQQWLTEEAQRPFNLAEGPLVRANLLRLGDEEHTLALTLHHIISDGWSFGVLLRELRAFYEAFATGEPATLPELPVQYADYAVWQRQWLQGDVLQVQLDYWKKQLAGAPPLELPTDRPRPPVQTYRGASQSLLIPPHLTNELRLLSRREGATLFMTLLAAFQAFLSRYTGQDDIVVGSPIAGRTRSEVEGLIGFFVNTLVWRADLRGDPTFLDVLQRAREVALGAYAHQEVPFEKLVEELQPERDLSRPPLFGVMFMLENQPLAAPQLHGLKAEHVQVESGTAKFDLTLYLEDTGQGLEGLLEYNTDLFDGGTISRMVDNFATLLAGIAADPNARLWELPLLAEGEQRRTLDEWNATQTEYSQDRCIHQLFEEQAQRTPDAVAVVFEDRQLTYQELNKRANQVAHHLRKLGVGPDVLVGICVERSIEMVVGLLGILKAGGAYVPLDPTYPKERLAYMMADSRMPVLLTQERLRAELPEHGARVVYLDTDWDSMARESEGNPANAASPDNLAYAIYTSGSTGQPKGVLVAHRGLCNVIEAKIRTYGVRPDSCVLQFVAFSFDVSVAEVFTALVSGARLCLGTPDSLLPGPAMVELMERQGVTTILMPPSVLGALPAADLPALQSIVVGGETCPAEIVARWAPGRKFFNTYGPTEATICNTIIECVPDGKRPPIGRTIANTQIYLLDKHLQPVPIGVAGEMHIGGVGLARGYHRRPDLTAERFIPNPFSTGPGARLYKTGDMARYLSDGNIEFVGRTDQQVKIRGFRVETEEIEAALSAHPSVRESVVVAREDVPGSKRLVAYVVPHDPLQLATGDLRTFLQGQLPDYMVPSAFVPLEALPLSPNGKVDRQALPAPDLHTPDTFVAPRNPVEETVAAMWAEMLDLKRVGVHDNFFELGGHSLLVTQVVTRLCDAFDVELPLRTLFEAPTVAGLSDMIELARGGTADLTRALPSVDWEAEATLDPTIRPDLVPPGNISDPAAIFITGASGFLGAFVCRELLQQTDADLYCLVRAKDAAQGMKKIKANLETYNLWHEEDSHRIIPIVGDLSEPMFGLPQEEYRLLASKVDVIYHNGGLVNFIHPYSMLKAANVSGTKEVLRLASHTRRKAVHFVSTLSVFLPRSKSDADVVREEDDPDDVAGLDDGYAQSKWVAERLVMAARSRGLPVCIYRPARITGHSQTGLSNTSDFLCRFIKGCVQLGTIPDWDIPMDMAPVDFVSKSIVYLSRQPDSLGKAFHIMNMHHLQWSEFANGIQAQGYPVRLMPYEAWRAALLHLVSASVENALEPFLPLFYQEKEEPSKKRIPQFDCHRTLERLASANIVCPPADERLLDAYFAYFMRSGFLDPPHSGNGAGPPTNRASEMVAT